MLLWLALAALAAWAWLVAAHGRFWRADQRLGPVEREPESWPAVVAVVPARDEAELVGRAVTSLVGQDYPGELHVFVVDDESTDGTAECAREGARARPERLTVARTPPRPVGWVGKMWAVHEGVRRAAESHPDAPLLWLTDADIVHEPDLLRRLVAWLEQRELDLASLLVRLGGHAGSERLLVPAFVYFFQMLFPFPRVNDPRRRTAAAAGGCMLLRRAALARAGGIEAVRGEVIDDCALARRLKRGGPIWLGLGERTRSIRSYGGLRGVWDMVARNAFTQLGYSWVLLALTILGLALLFVAPPLLLLAAPLHGHVLAAGLAAAAWLLMAVSFVPTLALYGRAAWWGLALPLAGVLYAAMTIDSARRYHRGRGAEWKGRAYAGHDTC